MTPPTAEEQDSRLQHDIRHLQLIRQAKDGGASWALIGAALGGISGKEAKRQARRLGARVQRELMASRRNG